MRRADRSFTLVELLVVIAIIAGIAALLFPAFQKGKLAAQRTRSLANMRQLGIGFRLYANEHDGLLPGRTVGTSDKWPVLLTNYLGSLRLYVAVGDTNAAALTDAQLINNSRNNTSYVFNGFNDLGGYTNPSLQVQLTTLASTVNLILLAQKITSRGRLLHGLRGGERGRRHRHQLVGNGANYVFADGSARFLRTTEYSNMLWCIDPNYQIPGGH